MNIRKLLAVGTLLPFCTASFSKPYLPIPEEFTTSDGKTIRIKTHGDEHFSYMTSADNKLVVDSAGNFFYVDNKGLNSGVKASDEDSRTGDEVLFLKTVNQDSALAAFHKRIGDRLVVPLQEKSPLKKVGGIKLPDVRNIANGKKKVPVILIESSQKRLITNVNNWDAMLNQDGYNKNGHIGSIKEYFLAQSDGKLEMDFEVFGPVFLSNRVDQMGDADILREALKSVNGNVQDYDADNDGYIDCTILVVAGQDTQADNGRHGIYTYHNKWNYNDAWLKGKKAGDYIYTTECSAYSGKEMDGQGSIIHEMGHVLGLPDLYPVGTSATVDTPKEWDVMDMGCYNGWAKNNTICGVCVPNFSFLERMCLGWADPIELTADSIGQYTLPEMTDGKAYIVKTNKQNEMFVIENRQKNGWDKELPGHGMLVWHFDYDADLWYYGKSNQDNNDRHIFLEPASQGSWGNKLAFYSYPGNGNVKSLRQLTDKNGNSYYLNINDIVEKDGYICFSTDGRNVENCPCEKEEPNENEDPNEEDPNKGDENQEEPNTVGNAAADNGIVIFGNGNEGEIGIKSTSYPTTWELVGANGISLANGVLTSDGVINTSGIAKGVYVLKVKNAETEARLKIVR